MRIRVAPDGANAWFWCRVLGHRPSVAAVFDRDIVYVCPRCREPA